MSTPNADRDAVDQAGLESFPASDPPAWGSHHAVASAATLEVGEDEPLFQPKTRVRRGRIVRGVIAMGLALGGLLLLAMRVRRRTRWAF